MISTIEEKSISDLSKDLKLLLNDKRYRLGTVSSIDGTQLVVLVLDLKATQSFCWLAAIENSSYPSLTPHIPQAHWFERELFDMFAIFPEGHPRLRAACLNESYAGPFAPLRADRQLPGGKQFLQDFGYMDVSGEGIFELPVGPVHAGIIEPGHFRFSCMGEKILNLEVRLGFVHRGIEKRMAQIPWRNLRFAAEAVASDTAAANALASAKAIESLLDLDVSTRAEYLRLIALEIERVAMHIFDIGGMAVDLGYAVLAAAFSSLRGSALGLAELLSGSRFLRAYICPGGVVTDPDRNLSKFRMVLKQLKTNLKILVDDFLSNSTVYERLHGVGILSASLAQEFGMVGVAARASSIAYDVRVAFPGSSYQNYSPAPCTETDGDALSRVKVRIAELQTSFQLIEELLDNLPGEGKNNIDIAADLPPDACGIGIVEAFRGELIHLLFTDHDGKIKRYVIKDPSANNWTGLAIAVRNNVIADFPICNKSFALSYSGHDL